ncbi:hypothetical protein N7456_004177 [Penicillium angulare]|uniref:Carrier domain-containing protein n=1 Tax=Penicillium angulare TaxID=116970 RepID=A0A9W9FW33_9EURO|nr:hypothetical protein N7456_004177 [Penicillium angulare]
MQLTFINGSEMRPGTNIIRHQQPCIPERINLLKQAWKEVIESERIFRTNFTLQYGVGYLVEGETSAFDWEEVIVDTEEKYNAMIEDLPTMTEVGFRFKVVIPRFLDANPPVACILWDVHHALVDGFSMSLLLEKVEHVARGRSVKPGPPFASISHVLQQVQQSMKKQGEDFWQTLNARFPGAVGEIMLPPPSETPEQICSLLHTVIPEVPQSRLQHYTKGIGVTTASIYMAAWALVLSQFSNSEIVVFGTVVSGRNLNYPGVAETIGPLVNTLPLYVSLKSQTMTSRFLYDIFAQLLELASFHWTTPEHGYSRQFSSAVAMQYETSLSEDLTGPCPNQKGRTLINSDIPLSLMIGTDGGIHIHYLNTHFNNEQIQLLGQQYSNALKALSRPSYTIEMCLEELMDTSFRQQLLNYGNAHSGLTTETSIHDDLVTLFDRAAIADPAAVAIARGKCFMTYRQLDKSSTRVAQYIKDEMKVRDGEIVCVHADQSMNWLVAIYGILKANGVYCALNQSLTPELRCSMFSSSTARYFLVPSRADLIVKPSACEEMISVEDILASMDCDVNESPLKLPRVVPNPAAAAYLCFTSGSTGKPKGVICTHRGLVAFQRDEQVRLFAGPGKRVAQLMSVSFDGSIHELFSTLSYGATLVLPDPTGPFDHLQRVDSAILTPSVAKILAPTDFPALKNVYLVGEPVPQDVNDLWAASKQLYNMYGPTEATCGATITNLVPGRPVTIGRPNPTTRIYILNPRRKLVIPGVIGEIYLAGVQVSNGYLNRPDATSERFLEDNICPGLGERMYATGDLGYWSKTGDLICLGRNDRQIKLRGFRLDLDDLESRVSKLPGVSATAITRRNDHLVAMLQPQSLCVASLRPLMAGILPIHAIPKCIVTSDQFPMTPAGKRDYRQILAAVESTKSLTSNSLTIPEQKIACVWAELLEIPNGLELSPESNFIDLGGHSILQLKLASRLSAVFECPVSPRIVKGAGSLRDMAQRIKNLLSSTQTIKPEGKGTYQQQTDNAASRGQVSPMEAEWLTKYALDCGTSAFNVSFAFELDSSSKRKQLINAWNKVLARQEILRSKFIQRRSGSFRREIFEYPPQVQLVQSMNLWKEVNRPFRLDMEYPVRVLSSPDVILFTATHTICDLTAMQLLLNEVTSISEGNINLLEDRSCLDSTTWSQVKSPEDSEFWTRYLEDVPVPNFPLLPGFSSDRASYHGTSYIARMPRPLARMINSVTTEHKITPHQLSLAAVALALQPDSDRIDLLLGAPHLNRPSLEDMRTVGLFLEPLGIRVQSPDATASMSTKSFLQAIQQSSQAALAHSLPWTQLWPQFDNAAEFPNHPLFDVMVTFHDYQSSLKFNLDKVSPVYTWARGSKFKLLFEFSALSDEDLLLRIEYDNMLFSSQEIQQTKFLIETALDLLSKESECREMRAKLAASMYVQPDTPGELDARALFGMRIEDICRAWFFAASRLDIFMFRLEKKCQFHVLKLTYFA